jgi:hypothetical protein
VIASVRIAKFISKTLGIPMFFDEQIKSQRWDVLILVNGAFAYCSSRDDVAVAVRKAKRIIWVQNDYAIYAPIPDGEAESTFRKAFRIRRDKGLPDMDHWTTVKAKAKMTEWSRYMNWNQLTALKRPLDYTDDRKDLFYYGAFRSGRAKTFDRYFKPRKMDITISSASKKFAERYDHARIWSAIERSSFYDELNSHGLGLYIEDPRSHREFHSPANRFYEMLSAGLPMVFEPDAHDMLEKAGYDITPYIAEHQRAASVFLRHRRTIQREQRKLWWDDFRELLTQSLRRAFRRYTQDHF